LKLPKKKGRAQHDAGPGASGWEIIYTGLVLILLSFFIMLSSFSSIEEGKIMRFVKSFVDAVSILPGGLKADGGTTIVPMSAEMVDPESPLARIYAELKALAEGRDQVEDITVSYSAKGLVMRLSDHALFDTGVAVISPEALPLLDKIGAVIAKTDYDVRVEGHTDDVPIKTALYPSNWELSTARAVNVLRYLIETYRIPSERLAAEGFGEFQPLVPNDSDEHRARNRRVEIVFLNPANTGRPAEGRP
jgi:chemotaxis protein MotB